jgi:hypothetical protein
VHTTFKNFLQHTMTQMDQLQDDSPFVDSPNERTAFIDPLSAIPSQETIDKTMHNVRSSNVYKNLALWASDPIGWKVAGWLLVLLLALALILFLGLTLRRRLNSRPTLRQFTQTDKSD